jgi:uncharacterized protein YkwD
MCGDACAADSRCTHFTWYQDTCWLKSGGTHAAGYLEYAVCGYINGRFNPESVSTPDYTTIDNGLADWETSAMLNRINALRAQNGRGPVRIDLYLMAASKDHSYDQAFRCYMDHDGSDGSKPWDRARRRGYPSDMVWENVANGADEVSSVMDMWWESQGHHDNILESSVTAVGFARVHSSCGSYWTQMFG